MRNGVKIRVVLAAVLASAAWGAEAGHEVTFLRTLAPPEPGIEGLETAVVPVAVDAGQTLLCDGTATLRLYDEAGRQVKQHRMSNAAPSIPHGPHDITFSCDFEGQPAPVVVVQFKALGEGEPVKQGERGDR